MKFSYEQKIAIGAAITASVTMIAVILAILSHRTKKADPERAMVYARQAIEAQVQTSIEKNGVFIELHDNSPKDKPNTSWTLWLYKYDGAEYLFLFPGPDSNQQIQIVKHK